MCGILGVVGKTSNELTLANYLAVGLNALQGRGYDGAGGAFVYNHKITPDILTGLGLVTSVFTSDAINSSPCDFACIGQTRYATSGAVRIENGQPFYKSGKFTIALVHNGQLVNPISLRNEIIASGGVLTGTSDSELIAHLIAHSTASTIEQAIFETCSKIRGAYSLLVMTHDKMIAVRDPHGIRPLSMCYVENVDGSFYIVSSETCALSIFNNPRSAEIEPGTIVVINQNGYRSIRFAHDESTLRTPCLFEFIYFAHPGSYLMGRSVKMCREAMGHSLAKRCHKLDQQWKIDGIVAIPESGVQAARGYHQESGLQELPAYTVVRGGIRIFMGNVESLRVSKVNRKRILTPEYIKDKRVIMVDDSTVRGDTGGQTIMQLRYNGAIEVHGRIPSPPIKHPCFYGMDISSKSELIAAKMPISEIAGAMNADTYEYLTVQETCKACGLKTNQVCHACMSGRYPIKIDPHEVVRCHD